MSLKDVDHLNELRIIFYKSIFGNLNLQFLRRDIVFCGDFHQIIHKMLVVQMKSGHIDGDWYVLVYLPGPGGFQAANFFVYIQIQLSDESVFLEKWNIGGGRPDSVYRVNPPGQSFGAVEPAGYHVYLWLQVYLKLAVFQGVFHLRLNVAVNLQCLILGTVYCIFILSVIFRLIHGGVAFGQNII